MDEKTIPEAENTEPDLIEMVRSKHREPVREEHISDVFVTQLCLCIALMLIFAALNIFCPEISGELADKIKSASNGEPEQLIADVVSKITGYIK